MRSGFHPLVSWRWSIQTFIDKIEVASLVYSIKSFSLYCIVVITKDNVTNAHFCCVICNVSRCYPCFFCIFVKRIHNILIYNVNFRTTGYSLRHVQQARIDRRLEAIESSVSYLAEILFFSWTCRVALYLCIKGRAPVREHIFKTKSNKTQHKRTHTEEITSELS